MKYVYCLAHEDEHFLPFVAGIQECKGRKGFVRYGIMVNLVIKCSKNQSILMNNLFYNSEDENKIDFNIKS